MKAHPHRSENSFSPEAEKFLAALYDSVGATDTEQKLNVLRMQLGEEVNFYALGGEVNDGMKLACLEYEYLELHGKIELQLA